ncbi:hypothetical protein GJAV_G00133010 [Gymnothorax javanicus]|nr:hypothetical protein GJAV_G00133010 [Gymnothorax javanicus]
MACNGAELSCFDRQLVQTCCHCHQDPRQVCGPVPLIPSLCCEETCSLERGCEACPLHPQDSLGDGLSNPAEGSLPLGLEQELDSTEMDHSETWVSASNIESMDCSLNNSEEGEGPNVDSPTIQGKTSTREDSPYPQCPELTADHPTEGQANARSSSPTESPPMSQNSLQE